MRAYPERSNNRSPMGHRLPQELLLELRTYLQHFDQTGHLGESATVAEIKRRLQQRIAEAEAELKLSNQGNALQGNASTQGTRTDPTR